MTEHEIGDELCHHITDVLNNIIKDTQQQIQKNNKKIWDEFLHVIGNEEWRLMFDSTKRLIAKHGLLLTNQQQRIFDESYATFKRDSQLRERCMDIRTKHKNTKDLAWAMIMIIRELFNTSKGIDIPNVDTLKPPPSTPREVKQRRREINITILETLFDVDA